MVLTALLFSIVILKNSIIHTKKSDTLEKRTEKSINKFIGEDKIIIDQVEDLLESEANNDDLLNNGIITEEEYKITVKSEEDMKLALENPEEFNKRLIEEPVSLNNGSIENIKQEETFIKETKSNNINSENKSTISESLEENYNSSEISTDNNDKTDIYIKEDKIYNSNNEFMGYLEKGNSSREIDYSKYIIDIPIQ